MIAVNSKPRLYVYKCMYNFVRGRYLFSTFVISVITLGVYSVHGANNNGNYIDIVS